jgi:hypothetical protein
MQRFVSTRASFVSQKKLYGYLKTRIGTQYPKMFKDELFIKSINIAKYYVFAACVSDLTIYAVAHVFKDKAADDADLRAVAMRCFESALADNAAGMPEEFVSAEAIAVFGDRLGDTAWATEALKSENFTLSPKELVKWAPIAPRLKKFDSEIVENSIRFAWLDIRERYLKQLDDGAVYGDWADHRQSAA